MSKQRTADDQFETNVPVVNQTSSVKNFAGKIRQEKRKFLRAFNSNITGLKQSAEMSGLPRERNQLQPAIQIEAENVISIPTAATIHP